VQSGLYDEGKTKMIGDSMIARGAVDLADVAPHIAQIWADLALDDEVKAALKRDGLALDGLRLTGPSSYQISENGGENFQISVKDGPKAQALLDLWQVHFVRALRLVRGA
jgi:hypothetical protein